MEGNNSYGTTWADQCDNSPDPLPETNKKTSSGMTAKYGKKVGEGLGKTKVVALNGMKKVKEGSSSGLHWMKAKEEMASNVLKWGEVMKKEMKPRMKGNLGQRLTKMKKLVQMAQMELVQVALAHLPVSHMMGTPQVQFKGGQDEFHDRCKIMKPEKACQKKKI
ncbi:hypothetical protein F0562_023770 [Nyssa sinensis]|uniref:Uncharacterized protein n=1 Tax=Nyssa sinensis TaxID=561372 RepID=A0A5J5BJ45_9ASTE|nr:hypothetical protein F0562_023770 [Nyssa sinensis]